jgi:hypothetical protein
MIQPWLKVKGKVILGQALGPEEVEASRISRQLAHDGRKIELIQGGMRLVLMTII